MSSMKVVAATVQRNDAVLYMADGTSRVVHATDHDVPRVLSDVGRKLAAGKTSVVIHLEDYRLEKRVEEATGGFLKLVRTGFNKLKAIVGKHEIEGVEKIQHQLEAVANGEADSIGLVNFMKRLADFPKERSHTVQELLRFLERGDLPLANDGSILAYKVLTSTGEDGWFVDCHTRKVRQCVGARVSMSEDLIDPSRRNECSTGLHIARRGYLRHFPGDIIALVKIAPEDVVAVPEYDANKMRVAAYHIIGLIPSRLHEVLRNNNNMTDGEEGAELLGAAVAGLHIGVTHEVVIRSNMGGDVVITDVADNTVIDLQKRAAPAKAVEPIDSASRSEPVDLLEKTRSAAQTGDLSAAINAEPDEEEDEELEEDDDLEEDEDDEYWEPVPDEIQEPVPAIAAKDEKAKKRELTEKQKQAMEMIRNGASQRKVASELGMCAKTIRKLVKEGYAQ